MQFNAVPDLAQVIAYRNPKIEQFMVDVQKPDDLALEEEVRALEVVARMLFEDTKLFLFLCACRGQLAPPPVIQEGWEYFLRFPKDYSTFCQRYFGHFIHPHPIMDAQFPQSLNELWLEIEDTRMFAAQAFGRLSDNWFNFFWTGR